MSRGQAVMSDQRRLTLIVICAALLLAGVVVLTVMAHGAQQANTRQDELIDQMQANIIVQQKSLEEANKRLEKAGKPVVEPPPAPATVVDPETKTRTLVIQGSQGPVGPAGPRGFTGKPGANGTAGRPGPSGATGATGATGTPGSDGVDGAPGEGGPPGDIGPAGPQGPQGDPGKDGANGADGRNGRGIAKVECLNTDELIVTYTDDTTDNVGGCTFIPDPTPTPVPVAAK